MILHTIVVGNMETNCYLVGCPQTKKAFLIDPGADYKRIKRAMDKSGLSVEFILNTHGHMDHIGANREFGLPIYIHRLDADFLTNPLKNLSGLFGLFGTSPKADKILEENDIVGVGNIKFKVIHTPGHTPGSICLKGNGVLFSGDTLFCQGVGRTDFPHSSEEDLFNSIKSKILVLDDDIKVYPGHGPETTIGEEKKSNPFIAYDNF